MTITANDRTWFRSHPNRLHRCRLATTREMDSLREMGALDRKVLAYGCLCIA
jgi:hypothetical protein